VLAAVLAGCEKMDLRVKGKTAEALLLVDPVQTGIPGLPDAQRVMGPDLFNQYVESQVLALKNRRVVWAALDALKGEQSLYKGPNPGKSLAQDLVVERIPGTMLIRVALTGRDPTQVQAIVREVVTQYIKQRHQDRAQASADAAEELRAERDDLRRQLDELARSLDRYRDELSLVISDVQASEEMARQKDLGHQLILVQSELAEARTAFEAFRDLLKPDEEANTKENEEAAENEKQEAEEEKAARIVAGCPEVAERLAEDPLLLSLEERVADLEIEAAHQRGAGDADEAAGTEAALRTARNLLQTRRRKRLDQLIRQHEAALKNRYLQARMLEADLQARLGEARARAVSMAKLAREFEARQRRYERVEEMLFTVEDQLERMRIESALARPTVRVVQWPTIPID